MKRSYYFVRHGQAVYQQKGFDRGAFPRGTDWPLSPLGERQAESVAPRVLRFGVERVVSSGLMRARQTARAIADAGRLPYEHHWPELNEVHPSKLRIDREGFDPEAWSFRDGYLAARAVRRYMRTGVASAAYDLTAIQRGIIGALERLDSLEESRLVVTGHGYWILLCGLFVGGRVPFTWIKNCSVTRIDADGRGHYRLVSFAEVV